MTPAPRRLPTLATLLAGIAVGALLAWGAIFLPRFWEATAPVPDGSIPRPVVCFTPGSDCTERIVAAIRAAREEVLVQAYSFTSPPIGQALAAARARGVQVRIIIDDSQLRERYSQADEVQRAGVEVWVDDPVGIAHNKVMVIDREVVITGSFNFSRSAQDRNAENLVLIRDRGLAALYAENWERRRAVSLPLEQAQRAQPRSPGAANDNQREPRRRRGAMFDWF